MPRRRFLWDTRAEAKAFARGVEHVNDSAVSVTSIGRVNGHYVVRLLDEENYDDDDATYDERSRAGRSRRAG